jgi:hypothetical protein
MLAVGLVRVGSAIGRSAEAAAIVERLHRDFDADDNLAELQRTVGTGG